MADQNLNTKITITAKDRAARVLKRLTGGLGRVRAGVFSLQGAFAALGAGLLVRDLIQTASEFENLGIQLEALQGSAEGGRLAMAWVKDFAKETPLSLQGVTQAFVRAKALGMDPMDGTMQSLVDISSKLGGGQDRLMGIVLAVGQAWTKQKLQADEANQLIERGVPVWDLLQTAMGKTKSELDDMAQKGELGRDAIKKLIDAMGASATGAAAANMKTFTGLWSNFGDQISQAKDEFAKADNGLFTFAKGSLQLGIDKLTEFRETGDLSKWGEDFANDIIDAVESGVNAFNLLLDVTDGLALNLLILQRGAVVTGNKFDAMNLARLKFERDTDEFLFGDDGKTSALRAEINDIQKEMVRSSQEAAELDTQINKIMGNINNRASVATKAFEDLREAISAAAKKEREKSEAPLKTVTVTDEVFNVFGPEAREKDRLIAAENLARENALIAQIEANTLAEIAVEAEDRRLEIASQAFDANLDLKRSQFDQLAAMSAKEAEKELALIVQSEEEKAAARVAGLTAATEQNEMLNEGFNRQFELIDTLGGKFGELGTRMVLYNKGLRLANSLQGAAASGIQAWILGQKKLGPALKQAAAGVLAAEAAKAAVLSIMALGRGFMLASSLPPISNLAPAAFKSAAIYASVAGVAGGAAAGLSSGGGGGGGAAGIGTSGGSPQNFQNQQNQQGGVKLDITINTLDPSTVDWDEVVENMETALGDKIESNGGNFGNVQLQFDTRGG